MVSGALLNMPLIESLGLGNVSFLANNISFQETQVNSSDGRARVHLADFSLFRRIS